MMIQRTAAAFGALLLAAACSNDPTDPSTNFEEQALLGVKTYINAELTTLNNASKALRDAAPAADADGWNMASDQAAVTTMRMQWKSARASYEKVEGAIAVLFPNLDASTDERYDGFLSEGPDDNLFDGEGVTGVHAIERILWANTIPAEVVTFESALEGYLPASFPANAAESGDYKAKLTERLAADTETMKTDFAPLALDTASAYRGVIGSMAEQLEKVNLATTGESESRYANYTLADMRANLDGGKEIYGKFKAWLASKDGGADLDAQINSSFAKVDAAYDALSGDAIPPVPGTWNPDSPSAADLATDYGKLWKLLNDECDDKKAGSLVSLMNEGANKLGIPTLPE